MMRRAGTVKRLPLLLGLLLLLWLATAARFYRLDAQSFWNDEGNSARLSERSIPLIVEGTASDIHPPLYYLLLHGWRELLGESEFALRALSAFLGVALVAGTFSLGRHLLARGALPAFIAALVVALHPALIYYSQETRMYQLLAFLALFSTLALWRLLPRLAGPWDRPIWLTAAAYLLLVVAGLYTHYFFPAILLVYNFLLLFWLLARWRRHAPLLRPFLRWCGLMLAALLLYLPWLPIFLRQTGGRPGGQGQLLPFLEQALRWLALGPTIEAAQAFGPTVAWSLLALLALLLLFRPRPEKPDRWGAGLLLLASLLPLLFMLLAGSTRPAYFKFMLVAVPFFALLASAGWLESWYASARLARWRWPLRLSLLALAAVALLGTGRSLSNLYDNPAFARADYRAMAARIAREDHPSAGIILDAPNQWEVFTYYYRDEAPVYPLPRGNPGPERLAEELGDIAARHDRLYALFWGEAEQDPQRLVERWLDAHAFKATEEWVGDVRFVTYAVPRTTTGEMDRPTDLAFGDKIRLSGYTLYQGSVRPGDILQVTLFWEALAPLAQRYKVFLHLVDESGQLVAQRDSEPGGGLALTTTWPVGETIVDNHGLLVPETPPGRYTLLLGLYELSDPTARLPISLAGEIVDAFPLAEIDVR